MLWSWFTDIVIKLGFGEDGLEVLGGAKTARRLASEYFCPGGLSEPESGDPTYIGEAVWSLNRLDPSLIS